MMSNISEMLNQDDKSASDNKVVAYTCEGHPITKHEMELSFLECQEQIKRGEVISLEDAIKESENWLKEDKF